MRKLLLTGIIILTAASCFAEGNTAEETAMTGEIGIEADLTTIFEFDSDLKFAQVIQVEARLESKESWRFAVSVRHNDEGWDHYANLWEVVDPESSLLYGQRVLAHPHDTEQPFTRTLSGIEIPEGVTEVMVRAKCTDHPFAGKAVLVDLTSDNGDGYTVKR
ncbi:MAG: hypothetical protein HN368_10285 [Spirochaetales bacterium]|jgi:hypothetical protein|nr:hypothetical protein [Spirochaetales bacterium]